MALDPEPGIGRDPGQDTGRDPDAGRDPGPETGSGPKTLIQDSGNQKESRLREARPEDSSISNSPAGNPTTVPLADWLTG